MIKKSITAELLLVVFSITVLYAQAQTPKMEPILTEAAVKGLIKNHEKLLESLNTILDGEDSKEKQWFESFQAALEKDSNPADFLKKNPTPKKLQTLFRKYGLDGKTGLLQIMVIAYAALNSEYGAIPIGIHPDDLKLVQKYHAELSELLKPIPVETESGSE
nr:hypothetical protein [uncultured Treponema sp.]